MGKDNKWRKAGASFRMEGIAFAIPTVLVVFPVVGAFIGRYLGDWLELPWLVFVGLLLGLIMGIRECIRMVRLLNRTQNSK